MRKLIIFGIFICCVAAAGCSKDAEVNSFLTEFESVTNEMTQKLKAGDVDGAKKAFVDNKASLQTSFDSIKSAREMQVSEDVQKKLESSVTENIKALSASATTAVIKSGGDKSKTDEIQTLLKDFVGIFQM